MKFTRIALFAMLAVVLAAGAVRADDVTEAIGQANQAYARGNLKETSTQLQAALVGVNQLLIEKLVQRLPDPPAGWQAEDAEGTDATAMGMSMFASLVVTRDYTAPNGSAIELVVAANSPMLATLRMFVSNPMLASMAGQSGMKKVSVCGYDAVQNFDDESENYELNIIAGSGTLIGLSGEKKADTDHIMTLANAIDCKGIVEIVE